MRIGLTGDTHNNINNIAKICAIFNQEKVDFVVHTGDITLPKSLEAFSMLDMPLKGVFGNNDQGELKGLNEVCKSYKFDFSNSFRQDFALDRKIFTVHDPLDISENFYGQGNIILHGHTHRYRNEVFKETHIFNPGECDGLIKGKNSIGVISVMDPEMEIIKF